MLRGYKTYIMGTVGVITAVATFLVGDAGLMDTLQIMLTAVMGMTIRHGITTTVAH